MNEINNEVRIRDLKQLGRQGGATMKLDNGAVGKLKEEYALFTKPAIIEGKQITVEVIEYYPVLLKQIRTIKCGSVLVARKVGLGTKQTLRLTGKGYHRKEKKGGI